MLLISWISILCGLIIFKLTGHKIIYMFTGQSNRILGIATAVCSVIDMVRIRFLEKTIFKYFNKKSVNLR